MLETIDKNEYVSLFGIKLLKPLIFGEAKKEGLRTLTDYLFAEYIGPAMGRKFFDRGGSQSRTQQILDRYLQSRETLASQNYKVRLPKIAPGLQAAYQEGIGTTIMQDMYTALAEDRNGQVVETPIHFRKFGEHEPSDETLRSEIRHARDHYQAPMEANRGSYEQVHNSDFDLRAMFERTNGDSESFIDLPALRRWTVRDETKVLANKYHPQRITLDVDGVDYEVRRYTPKARIVNGKAKPAWDFKLFGPHFLFSVMYKIADIAYNLVPTADLRAAAKQNLAKEEYKAIAGIWRAVLGGQELAYSY